MRMFQRGQSFSDVPADFPPEGKESLDADGNPPPTFSEAFLYPTVGKGDARFVLGVADEYEHLIKLLGDVTPRLLDAELSKAAQARLRTIVSEFLEEES